METLLIELEDQTSDCGYCGSKNTFVTEAVWCISLTGSDYDQLMNTGWRRSGHLLYRPIMDEICCKLDPIRVKVNEVVLRSSQRKCLRRFLRLAEVDCDIELSVLWKTLQTSPKLELRLVAAENQEESFALYRRYQNAVHEEGKSSRESFKSFLCESPLKECSMHLQWWWKDVGLIALSILDILPTGISSVYFIYDAQLDWVRKLSMGTVSAMIEMSLADHLQLPFYHLGYYLETCPKMRYKAQFGPAEILDPTDWTTWRPFTPQ